MSLIVDGTTGVTFNDSSLQGAAASPYVLKNRIINGAMMIDQRNAGASVALGGSSKYAVDRFISFYTNTGGAATAQQSTTVPAGFKNSMVYTVTTGAATSSGDYSCIQQNIEGLNIADLDWGLSTAKTITLSFWVRSSLTGTFSGSLNNNGASRSYVYTYTISAANTWEFKTITIAGDTTGTWLTTNGTGISVYWDMGFGSGASTSTANTWLAGAYNGLTTGVKPSTTTGATFYITGVQLEIGTSATPFERRLYGNELALCQRYYYRRTQAASTAYNTATAFSSTSIGFSIPFPVEMRIVPTALEQTGTASNYAALNTTGGNISCSSVPTYNSATTSYSAWTNFTVASGLTAGNASAAWSAASSYLAWSAEL